MSNKKNSYSRDDLKISEGALRIADAIKSELKIGEAGVIEPLGKDAFKKLLPDGLTEKDVQRVDAWRSDLIAGVSLAVGEKAIEAFSSDKKIETVSFTMPVNKDKLDIGVERRRTYPNRMGGEGAPDIVKHAALVARYQVAASGNRGDFGRVRSHLSAQAAKIFG